MSVSLFNWFVKITSWPVQFFCFRTKVSYEDKSVQGRRVRGGAIIISNHTSVFDYAVYLFVFFGRTLRVQMAEVLFRKKGLGLFLRALGGIYVDRSAHDMSAVLKSRDIVERGGVVGIFPEGRLPKPGEGRPLRFHEGAAYLALMTGAPVIPVYTNGSYFCKRRARVVIGKPMYAKDLSDGSLSEKEELEKISEAFRQKVISLGQLLPQDTERKK